jgi:hypothetical protein
MEQSTVKHHRIRLMRAIMDNAIPDKEANGNGNANGGVAAWTLYWKTLSMFLIAQLSKAELDSVVFSVLDPSQGSYDVHISALLSGYFSIMSLLCT